MTTTVSLSLINKLTTMLAEKLVQEVSVAATYKADFQSICEELVAIKSLLSDASDKRSSDSVTNWLQKLQNFLNEAVETIEKCEVEEADNNLLLLFCDPFFSYRMGRRIRELKARIREIHASGKEYITYLASVMDVNARLHDAFSEDEVTKSSANPTVIEDDLVGNMREDIRLITEMIGKEDKHPVIAVVGMAGLGKTLLVQHVFQNFTKRRWHLATRDAGWAGKSLTVIQNLLRMLRRRFDYLIWLSVTQKFDVKNLLIEIDRQIDPEHDRRNNQRKLSELSMDGLTDRIHTHLEGKRCLFVLDDVWQKDILQQIGLPLVKNKNKILVTTRDKLVAQAMEAHYTLRMNYLSDENSLELFCVHAFHNKKLPAELTGFRNLILEKCTRLPLAIKEIAKPMAGVRRIPSNWSPALYRLDEASIINTKVMPALRLSYQALPHHLKPCFLYFSLFPPNYPIKDSYIWYAWIALEFVSPGLNAYDEACSYLKELVNQSMIQSSPVHRSGRERYETQDLLHHLAVSQSHTEGKCLLMPRKDLKELPPVNEYRGKQKISLVQNDISGTINDSMATHCPKLRILLLQKNRRLKSISATLFNKLNYLVVLDLSKTAIKSLPKSIGNLVGLKFLNLSRTMLKTLPTSLSGLQSLQYLDISKCVQLESLHSGIGNHKCMLHLNLEGCKKLVSLPAGISELLSLRTLKLRGVVLKRKNAANAFQWKHFRSLTGLKQISITFNSEAISSPDFLKTWQGMINLQKLRLQYIPSIGEYCPLLSGLEYMEHLKILKLHNCKLLAPPPKCDWILQFLNLKVLVLDGDESYSADHYRVLERIPLLETLVLSKHEKCVELPREFGDPDAFPELKRLFIEDFKCLKYFPPLKEKAMPKLEHLTIKNCIQLRSIPSGIEKLTNLRELELDGRLLEESHKFLKESQIKIKEIPAASSSDTTAPPPSDSDEEAEAEADPDAETDQRRP